MFDDLVGFSRRAELNSISVDIGGGSRFLLREFLAEIQRMAHQYIDRRMAHQYVDRLCPHEDSADPRDVLSRMSRRGSVFLACHPVRPETSQALLAPRPFHFSVKEISLIRTTLFESSRITLSVRLFQFSL